MDVNSYISSPVFLITAILNACGLIIWFKLLDSKAGMKLMALLMLLSMGVNRLIAYKITDKQSAGKTDSQGQIVRAQDQSGYFSAMAGDGKTIIFKHTNILGAAAMTDIRQLNEHEWMAFFVSQNNGLPGSKISSRMQGWFERALPDASDALPLVRRYQSIGGTIRVEDEVTNETLFTYEKNGPYQPVAIVRQGRKGGFGGWQIMFSSKPGVSSEQSAAKDTARR